MKFAVLLPLVILISNTFGAIIQEKDEWTHGIDREAESGIKIKWRHSPLTAGQASEGERWIIMQVSAQTKGYVGVGFSPNGAMTGADIVIGWVDSSGKSYLKDFYAEGNEKPILDEKQDYELIGASQDGETTTLEFRRKWETCDDKDLDIVKDTMRLIWAYGTADPKIGDDGTVTNLQWHGGNNRGAVSVYVVDDAFAQKFPEENDPDVKTWNMFMDNFKPLIKPETKKHVHHITFYECQMPPGHGNTADVFEKHIDSKAGMCYTAAMPPDWGHCATFLFVWVSGSQGEMVPEHVGIPLGEEHGGSTYFMMEIHYDNPEFKTFTDSSGVAIYYTDKLRQYDGSALLIGYRLTPFLLIPPAQKKFVTYGICSRECTENALPEDGINVIITLVHAHTHGRKLRLRHFRDGKELPKIAEDNHYDFNYQQSRVLKDEIKILRGDELMVECEYESTQDDRIVLGGLTTKQEMCQTFLLYYPRIDLMQCTSQYEINDFFGGLGIDSVNGTVLKDIKMPYNPNLLPPEQQGIDGADDAMALETTGDGASFKSMFDNITIESPEKLKGMSVGSYLKKVDWKDKELAFGKTVEEKWKNGKHYAFCTANGRRRVPLKDYVIPFPNIKEPLQKPKSTVCDADTSNNIEQTFSYSEPARGNAGNEYQRSTSIAAALLFSTNYVLSLLTVTMLWLLN